MAYSIPYIPGLYEFYLPFLIVFAVIYALVDRAKIFGDPQKSKVAKVTNLIVSLGFGLFIAPIATPFVTFLVNLFGQTLVLIFTIIAILITTAVVPGLAGKEVSGKWVKYIAGAIFLIVLLIFFNSGGVSLLGLFIPTGVALPSISQETLAGIVMIGITILIIAYLLIGGSKEQKKGGE